MQGHTFSDKIGSMKLYRFSPIKTKSELLKAITYTHFACYTLCKQSFWKYLPNAGNIGIFCHYDQEFIFLTKLRKEMTEVSDNWNQKYFRLHEPIVIPARSDIPKTLYTYLYIRKPDPYRHHVGDVDFYLEPKQYYEFKKLVQMGNKIKGARILDRPGWDMVELYDPDIDACGYVSIHSMTEKVRVSH